MIVIYGQAEYKERGIEKKKYALSLRKKRKKENGERRKWKFTVVRSLLKFMILFYWRIGKKDEGTKGEVGRYILCYSLN